MERVSRKTVIVSSLLLGLSLFIASDRVLLSGRIENFLANTFFVQSVTVEELQIKFVEADETGPKLQVLIVPGHEPDFGGAEYGSLKERDMNVDMARELAEQFAQDERFEVIVARDKEKWNPMLEAYFENNWEAIKTFVKLKKLEMDELLSDGRLTKDSGQIIHNRVSDDVALRLYGINKWASEREMDLVIHIHFNDHPRANMSLPGRYRGFAIYIPDRQYSNAVTSRGLAKSVFDRLEESFAVSDFPQESEGILESQNLIATGAKNTLKVTSVLIEYGYVYRPAFTNASSRLETMDEMSKLTYLGIIDFFQPRLD